MDPRHRNSTRHGAPSHHFRFLPNTSTEREGVLMTCRTLVLVYRTECGEEVVMRGVASALFHYHWRFLVADIGSFVFVNGSFVREYHYLFRTKNCPGAGGGHIVDSMGASNGRPGVGGHHGEPMRLRV